jgi:RNA polymerase sigma-70 factor (ECF subfamily)
MTEFDIKDFRNGGGRSWDFVYKKFRGDLLSIAFYLLKDAQTAEDMVQEAIIKAWKSKENYNDLQHLERSVKKIIRNLCIDQLRSKKKQAIKIMDMHVPEGPVSEQTALSEYESIAKELHWRRLFKEIELEIPNLSPRQKEIFRLHWLNGLSHSEIAEQLDIAVQSVRNEYLDARKALRKRLRDQGLARPMFFTFLKILLLFR